MKRKAFFLIAIFHLTCYQTGFSQNQRTIDSLLKILPNEAEDTNKAKILINLASEYGHIAIDKCFNYAVSALKLAQKLNFKPVIGKSYMNIAIYYVVNGDFQKGIENCQKAIDIAKENNDKSALCNLSNVMSMIYDNQGDNNNSLKYEIEAVRFAEELKDTARIAMYNLNIGLTYQNTGVYSTALNYFLKALRLNEIAKKPRDMANTYDVISRNYILAEKDTIKALKYAELSLKYAQEANDQIQVASSLELLGIIYQMKKEWNKSLEYHQGSIRKSKEMGIEILGSTYSQVGELYREQNKLDSAISYYLKGLEIGNRTGRIDDLESNYYGLGKAYQSKKKYKQSIDYLEKSLAITKKQSSPAHEKETRKALAEVYAEIHDFKSAYNYLSEYIKINDSIAGKETLKMNADIREKYESEKKENEIKLLSKDKEVKDAQLKKQKQLKNSFIAGLALLSVLSVFVFNNFRVRNKLRLQDIRNRIAGDLHDDIGSTLNSISVYSEVAKQKSPTVVQELEQIGEASRKIIDAMSDIVWTINPKNDSFENIILRMRSLSYNLLKAKNIEHSFRADEGLASMKLSMEDRRNFFLVFKEAVNNLVKYSEATRASIILSRENNLVTLSVRDNGKGFDVKQYSTGNGLLNMRSRAAQMNADIKIESNPGDGTTIELALKV